VFCHYYNLPENASQKQKSTANLQQTFTGQPSAKFWRALKSLAADWLQGAGRRSECCVGLPARTAWLGINMLAIPVTQSSSTGVAGIQR
jgi:hypothetical protein